MKLPLKHVAIDGGWDGVVDADNTTICKIVYNEPDNAAAIVRAVNMHESLVEALRFAIERPQCTCGDDIPGRTGDCSCGWASGWRQARAVLAKVEKA